MASIESVRATITKKGKPAVLTWKGKGLDAATQTVSKNTHAIIYSEKRKIGGETIGVETLAMLPNDGRDPTGAQLVCNGTTYSIQSVEKTVFNETTFMFIAVLR